jgi:hypothetical protein
MVGHMGKWKAESGKRGVHATNPVAKVSIDNNLIGCQSKAA